jgi:hypothetical protein
MPTFEIAQPERHHSATASAHSGQTGYGSSAHHHKHEHQVHQHHHQRQSHGVGYAKMAHSRNDDQSSCASDSDRYSDMFQIGRDAQAAECEVIAGAGKGAKGRKIQAEGWTTFAG